MKPTKNLKQKVTEFLESLEIENLNIIDYVDIDNIDFNNPFQSIYDLIQENGGFNIEIIYYNNAINYLKKNDPSLNECLEIASDLGYDVNSLDSEVLASLLASEYVTRDFYNLEQEVNDFFYELEIED